MNKKERIEAAIKTIVGQGKSDIDSAKLTFSEILVPNFMVNTPYEQCLIINLPDGTDAAKINYSDDGFLGGITVTWVDEGELIPIDKASFKTKNVEMGKLGVAVPLTNEISQDVPTLAAYLSKQSNKAVRNEVCHAIIYNGGTNVEVQGILESSKQATKFIDVGTYVGIVAQVNAMYKFFAGVDNGVWLFSKDKYIELVDQYDSDLAFSVERPFGQLWGLPIIVAPFMESGDVVLGDFSAYVIAQKEMRSSISESVYFDTDQSCLKISLRIGGKVPYGDGWTNTDGYKVYPFVALSDMEGFSSSSSSSSSEEFSSSSSSSHSSSSNSSSSSSESSDSSGSSDSSELSSDSTELSSDSSELSSESSEG